MSGIFLSYRRDDSLAWAGRLYDFLVREWGPDHVFMDIDAIAPGEDFRDAIAQTMRTCDVVLVVIGPNWVNSRNQAGNRRLDDETDTHRAEVASALAADVRVVPVLVGEAAMPTLAELPEPLRDLAYRNAAIIEDRRFQSDAIALQHALTQFAVTLAAKRAGDVDASRRAEQEETAPSRPAGPQRQPPTTTVSERLEAPPPPEDRTRTPEPSDPRQVRISSPRSPLPSTSDRSSNKLRGRLFSTRTTILTAGGLIGIVLLLLIVGPKLLSGNSDTTTTTTTVVDSGTDNGDSENRENAGGGTTDGGGASSGSSEPCRRVVNDPEPPLNVREGPDNSFGIVDTLENGTEVNVVANSGGWLQIDSPVSGWIFEDNTTCE
jgi:hypothetical protein